MITVVIPVRNRAALVERTLRSVEAQTLAPDAVILVDNASTDGTLDVLRRWAATHPATEVIEEPTPGAACARNAGLRRVKSPYVMFFDSDDIMPPKHIEQVTQGIRNASMPDIVTFDMVIEHADGREERKTLRRGDLMRMQIFHSFLSTIRYAASTATAREAGGWNEALLGWDDMEFGVRLLTVANRVCRVELDEPVRVCPQADSITGTDFHSKAGQWERALDSCGELLRGSGYERYIDYRRAILAGTYRREGHADLAKGLTSGPVMKFIERYVAAGGRGVASIARVLELISGRRACARVRRE